MAEKPATFRDQIRVVTRIVDLFNVLDYPERVWLLHRLSADHDKIVAAVSKQRTEAAAATAAPIKIT